MVKQKRHKESYLDPKFNKSKKEVLKPIKGGKLFLVDKTKL